MYIVWIIYIEPSGYSGLAQVAIPSSFGLDNPMGMYLEGTDIYVADTRNGRVVKFPNGNTNNAEEVLDLFGHCSCVALMDSADSQQASAKS